MIVGLLMTALASNHRVKASRRARGGQPRMTGKDMSDLSALRADFVIVGAGVAGSVLAARLSEQPGRSVILVEAGGENDYEQSGYSTGAHAMFETSANWAFKTTPQAALNGAEVPQPRGKVIGGSAAINIGSWSRGIAADYDAWEAAGASGWNWSTARDAYCRIEASRRPDGGSRGRNGPLQLEDTSRVSSMTDRFRQACLEAGYGATADHNGAEFGGFDLWETIFVHGRRRNAADAYLLPARIRSNLHVVTDALVTRIILERNQATGVEIERDGHREVLTARREVVLAAGTFGTPQILMLSGLGQALRLQALGIECKADLPGVGRNLIDHLATKIGWASEGATDIAPVYPDPDDPSQLETWRRDGTGPLSANPNTCIAFVRSSTQVTEPDIELLMSVNPPEIFADDGRTSGCSVFVADVQPRSRGTLSLSSPDPHDAPTIDPAYLTDPQDLPTLVAGVRRGLALSRTNALKPYAQRYDLAPEADDGRIADWIRMHPVSMYHPVGTARMGAGDDPRAVLDPQLRVRGIQGLRVADASAMPGTIRGHTMAPVTYVAERAAVLIRGQAAT